MPKHPRNSYKEGGIKTHSQKRAKNKAKNNEG
jgi:hypothetical protein